MMGQPQPDSQDQMHTPCYTSLRNLQCPASQPGTSQPGLVTADASITGELPTETSVSAFRLRISPRMLQVGEFPDNLGIQGWECLNGEDRK